MAETTTIRLPPELRARLAALAEQTDRSAHSLILEAIERYADYEEDLRRLVREALGADAAVATLGEIYRPEDVNAWLDRLAAGEAVERPKPWRR
jgi:predicted transcriptional regulator